MWLLPENSRLAYAYLYMESLFKVIGHYRMVCNGFVPMKNLEKRIGKVK
jgi:hypothetical protein